MRKKELEAKVKELEERLEVSEGNLEIVRKDLGFASMSALGHSQVMFSHPLPTWQKLKMLLDHLNLEFKHEPATPERTAIRKKAKGKTGE
jgi:hypothetical protein